MAESSLPWDPHPKGSEDMSQSMPEQCCRYACLWPCLLEGPGTCTVELLSWIDLTPHLTGWSCFPGDAQSQFFFNLESLRDVSKSSKIPPAWLNLRARNLPLPGRTPGCSKALQFPKQHLCIPFLTAGAPGSAADDNSKLLQHSSKRHSISLSTAIQLKRPFSFGHFQVLVALLIWGDGICSPTAEVGFQSIKWALNTPQLGAVLAVENFLCHLASKNKLSAVTLLSGQKPTLHFIRTFLNSGLNTDHCALRKHIFTLY